MALIKCRECGGEVSTEANNCPKCGAAVSKGTSRFTILVGGAFAIAVGSCIFQGDKAPESAAVNAQQPTMTPATLAAQAAANAAKARETARFDLAFDAAKAIKAAMRDPDSLKWESIGVNEDGTVACLKYRARNGFGGMNSEFAVVANNAATRKMSDWKKYCTGPLHDLTSAG
jgi:hypothetical protein